MQELLDVIEEYKNLAIECALQENETNVKDLAERKSCKLNQILKLINLLQIRAEIKGMKEAAEKLGVIL